MAQNVDSPVALGSIPYIGVAICAARSNIALYATVRPVINVSCCRVNRFGAQRTSLSVRLYPMPGTREL